ncbi:MAG: glycoside hydrolase family 1 protein, partial [Clostridium sp.]
DRVKYWTTFNEPIVVVEGQYLYGFHYPKLVDGKKAVQCLYNLNLASAKAIEAYRELKCDGKIGIVLNLTPSYPRDKDNEEDVRIAKLGDDFFNNSFLDPAVHGIFPENLVKVLKKDNVLWESTEEELNIIKNNTVDFLGVNYYQPRRIKPRETEFDNSNGWMPDKYFEMYEMPGRRMNPYRGWEIYPEAMYDIAMNIKENYKNISWFISENGMGVEGEERYINKDGKIEDDYRIDFFKEHLEHLHRGIEEGSNCFGFHSWTPIDCWSWCNAYKNRYGYISLDLKTLEKKVKKSGEWIKEVAENNGF